MIKRIIIVLFLFKSNYQLAVNNKLISYCFILTKELTI